MRLSGAMVLLVLAALGAGCVVPPPRATTWATHDFPALRFGVQTPADCVPRVEGTSVHWSVPGHRLAAISVGVYAGAWQRQDLDAVEKNRREFIASKGWQLVEPPARLQIDGCAALRMLVRSSIDVSAWTYIDEPQGTYYISYGDRPAAFHRPAADFFAASFKGHRPAPHGARPWRTEEYASLGFRVDVPADCVATVEPTKVVWSLPGGALQFRVERWETAQGLDAAEASYRKHAAEQSQGAWTIASADRIALLGFPAIRIRPAFKMAGEAVWHYVQLPQTAYHVGWYDHPATLDRAAMDRFVQSFRLLAAPAPAPTPRGFLGIMAKEGPGGPEVERVVAGSPAEAAGIRPGNVVRAIGGRATPDGRALMDALSAFRPGDRVEIALRDAGQDRTLSVVLGTRPEEASPPAEASRPTAPGAPPAQAAPATPATPATAGGATREPFVLIVGINDYQDARIPDLRFAEQDARAVYGFFATERRSPTRPERVRLLLGKDATRMGILRAVREHLAMQAVDPEDAVVLYFAGHGFADARETYVAGADALLDSLPESAISMPALREALGAVRARTKVVLADACHSGGLGGFRGIGGVALAPAPAPAGGAAAGHAPGAAPEEATITIAATGPNELSVEDPNVGQGVFTIALLKGLRGEAEADGDGRVSDEELERYLAREVPALAARAGGRQSPVVERRGAGARRVFLTR